MPIRLRPEDVNPIHLKHMLNTVHETIQKIRYERLRVELLQGVNPEINTDREVLISRMEQMGFRRDIVTALEDVERKVMAAGTPLDFKGCMDIVRTVFEEIVEDAAKKAATITKKPIPTGKLNNFLPWKQLLVNAGVCSDEEADLVQKHYNYFSTVMSVRTASGVSTSTFAWRAIWPLNGVFC